MISPTGATGKPLVVHYLAHERVGADDAELELLKGHSKSETLAIHQHIALDSEVEAKYQEAMKEAGL